MISIFRKIMIKERDIFVLQICKEAKSLYEETTLRGMCYCFATVLEKRIGSCFTVFDIPRIIPEFNRIYLCGDINGSYWWPLSDRESRLKAFDKLIAIYEQKQKTETMNWIRTDGLLHILVSAVICAALGWIRPLWAPPAITILIGVGKEIYDRVSGKGVAEWHDVICDLIGILVGMIIILLNRGHF